MSVVADCDCASEEHICDCGRDQTWYPCDGEWDCEVCILEARIDELKDYSDTMNERMCEAFYERDELKKSRDLARRCQENAERERDEALAELSKATVRRR
jgi:hypothetical protein